MTSHFHYELPPEDLGNYRYMETHSRVLGVSGLNPWPGYNSASRVLMFSSQLQAAMTLINGDMRRTYTGMERRFGELTHSIKFPTDSEVLDVISKHPKRFQSGKDNSVAPETLVVFRSMETGEVDVLEVKPHFWNHQHFGFDYKFTKNWDKLGSSSYFRRGDKLADSPSIDDHGNYRMGVSVPIAFISSTEGNEDGICIAESLVERLASTGYGQRQYSWGKTMVPLNLYGDDEVYKPFPEIGDPIRDDRIIMAFREYNPDLAPSTMSASALREVRRSDRKIYAEAGSVVVDINVIKGSSNNSSMSEHMDVQPMKYWKSCQTFYKRIVERDKALQSNLGPSYRRSAAWHRTVVDAIAMTESYNRPKVRLSNRKSEHDDWHVDITFKYLHLPRVGSKATDLHAGKAVIVRIRPDHEMPIDADGNRALAVMDSGANVNRMNKGRLYEQAYNACGRKTQLNLIQMHKKGRSYEEMWEYLLPLYRILTPLAVPEMTKSSFDYKAHIDDFMENGHYFFMPPDNPIDGPKTLALLRKYYPPCLGPVELTKNDGTKVMTRDTVLIGEVYMIPLDRAGNSFSAVSSAPRQHFGVLAKPSKADKHTRPIKESPTRIAGESETRLFYSACGGEMVAELLDQTNDPKSHRAILDSITHAVNPAAIDKAIDRKKLPRRGGRVMEGLQNVLSSGGVRFTKFDEAKERKKGMTFEQAKAKMLRQVKKELENAKPATNKEK